MFQIYIDFLKLCHLVILVFHQLYLLENELNYKIRHGEAVSVGLLMAMKLSFNLGYATKKDFNLLENHLKRFKLPIELKDL